MVTRFYFDPARDLTAIVTPEGSIFKAVRSDGKTTEFRDLKVMEKNGYQLYRITQEEKTNDRR